MKPLAIDLFCGLGGWTEGLLAEGYRVVGYDIEAHEYGDMKYPGELVLADVLTLHGSQFKDADLIVASPPCQEYSYMAMPWKLAKAKAAAIRADASGKMLADLNRLFDACFRIQKEASIAAGRRIPLIVENVRGAIPWVGRSRWNFGSYHLWGDVPALMPVTVRAQKFNPDGTSHGQGSWFAIADSKERGARKNDEIGGGSWFAIGGPGQKVTGANPDGRKVPGFRFDGSGRSLKTASVEASGLKTTGHLNLRDGHSHTRHLTNPKEHAEVSADLGPQIGGDWFSDPQSTLRKHGSKSKGRKMASAMIAKIPLPLSRYIAATFKPKPETRSEAA